MCLRAQSLRHVRLCDLRDYIACQAPLSMEFPRQEYWSGLPFPSPGFFPTQGSNLGLPHWRQILYRLSHQGSLRRQTPAYIYAQNFSSGTNLLSKLIKIQVKALRSFSALKTQFLGSVRSVSNHMLLGVMQNGICLKAYTQKLIVVSQILSYSFIPRINYQS